MKTTTGAETGKRGKTKMTGKRMVELRSWMERLETEDLRNLLELMQAREEDKIYFSKLVQAEIEDRVYDDTLELEAAMDSGEELPDEAVMDVSLVKSDEQIIKDLDGNETIEAQTTKKPEPINVKADTIEDLDSTDDRLNDAAKKVMADFEKFKETHTKEDWVNEADNKLNTLKSVLAVTLEKIGHITGCSKLKKDLQIILEAGLDKSSTAAELMAMAKKCRERVNDEIEIILCFEDDLALKDAMTLKRVIDAEGNKQDIFTSVATGLVWLARKITSKIKDWTGKYVSEKDSLKELCKATSSFLSFLRGTIKISYNILVTGISFVVAGGIKLAVTVYHSVLCFFKRIIKDWNKIQHTASENEGSNN